MGVKTIHSNTQRTDNPILPTYWRRENEAIVLATGRNDVNNRAVSTTKVVQRRRFHGNAQERGDKLSARYAKKALGKMALL